MLWTTFDFKNFQLHKYIIILMFMNFYSLLLCILVRPVASLLIILRPAGSEKVGQHSYTRLMD